jgi:hypothetical protein
MSLPVQPFAARRRSAQPQVRGPAFSRPEESPGNKNIHLIRAIRDKEKDPTCQTGNL